MIAHETATINILEMGIIRRMIRCALRFWNAECRMGRCSGMKNTLAVVMCVIPKHYAIQYERIDEQHPMHNKQWKQSWVGNCRPIRNEQFNLTIGFRNSIAYWKQLQRANILAFECRRKLRAFKFGIALWKALKIECRSWEITDESILFGLP